MTVSGMLALIDADSYTKIYVRKKNSDVQLLAIYDYPKLIASVGSLYPFLLDAVVTKLSGFNCLEMWAEIDSTYVPPTE